MFDFLSVYKNYEKLIFFRLYIIIIVYNKYQIYDTHVPLTFAETKNMFGIFFRRNTFAFIVVKNLSSAPTVVNGFRIPVRILVT